VCKPTFVLALGDLISPHAHASIAIVSQSGGALVSGGLAVPAVPEHVALVLIGEDAVQAGAVGSGDWGFYSKYNNNIVKKFYMGIHWICYTTLHCTFPNNIQIALT